MKKQIVNAFNQPEDTILNCCGLGFVDDESEYYNARGASAANIAVAEAARKRAIEMAEARKLADNPVIDFDEASVRANTVDDSSGSSLKVDTSILDGLTAGKDGSESGSYDEKSGEVSTGTGSSNKMLLYGGIGLGAAAIITTVILVLRKKGKKA